MTFDEQSQRAPGVLLLDDQEPFSTPLASSFSQCGFEVRVRPTLDAALALDTPERISIIVTELRVGGVSALNLLPALKRLSPNAALAIVTAYPSVATAVQAVRSGFDTYLPKPVTAPLVLKNLNWDNHRPDDPFEMSPSWPSLNRTVWEYLNQVRVTAGSMSEAARRLGLDRRSLRRMMAKYPPAR